MKKEVIILSFILIVIAISGCAYFIGYDKGYRESNSRWEKNYIYQHKQIDTIKIKQKRLKYT